MSDLVERLGEENVRRLAEAAGGTKLSVPQSLGTPPTGGHDASARLISALGEALTALLIFHFGGCLIYVPTLRPRTPIDEQRLKQLERKGLSAREIALALGCTDRAIERRRAKQRTKDSTKTRKETPA